MSYMSAMDQITFAPSPERARDLRTALGQFATGVTVVTTLGPNGPVGITANSFASVSLDPALVMWCPARSSSRFAAFTECNGFAIHVLGEDQREIGNGFVKDGQAFDGLDYTTAVDGTPLLTAPIARFYCTPHAFHDGGDHVIAVGLVQEVALRPAAPLLFASGQYGRFTQG